MIYVFSSICVPCLYLKKISFKHVTLNFNFNNFQLKIQYAISHKPSKTRELCTKQFTLSVALQKTVLNFHTIFFPPHEQNLLELRYISAVLALGAHSELLTGLSFWTF